MNAPKLNFDGRGGSGCLPATAATTDVGLVGDQSREFYFNHGDTGAESGGDFRKWLFMYIGLALKYRWLILTFCGIALAIGFVINFTSTPIYQATVTIQIDRQAP